EPDVLEDESPTYRPRDFRSARIRGDRRFRLEEIEHVLQVERLLVDGAGSHQQTLDQVATAGEGGGKKGERADGDDACNGTDQDDDVGGIVPERAQDRQQRRNDPLADRELLVLLIEFVRQHPVAFYHPRRQT